LFGFSGDAGEKFAAVQFNEKRGKLPEAEVTSYRWLAPNGKCVYFPKCSRNTYEKLLKAHAQVGTGVASWKLIHIAKIIGVKSKTRLL